MAIDHTLLNVELLAISRDQLELALRTWETCSRQGLTISHEDAAMLPVDQVAAAGADYLWNILVAQNPNPSA